MGGQRVALLTVLSVARWSHAVWIRGTKEVPANSAVFLAKYCFDFDPSRNNTGSGEVDFILKTAGPAKGIMKFILLDDQSDSYPDTNNRWPGYDCDDESLKTVAKAQLAVQVENLPSNNRLHTFIVERLRPRYWFVAALDCSGQARTIEYELHLVNIEQGWLKEVSMDHCGIWALGTFSTVYLLTALLQVHAIFLQSTARTKHPLRLLLAFGICAALWGMGFYTFDTFWYAARGEETFLLYFAAKGFKAWSKFTLLLIAILMSKGRGISRDLQVRDIFHGTLIVGPLMLLCLGVELWGEFDQSRKYTTSFVYSTWFGGVLIFADLVLLVMYVRNVAHAYSQEGDARKKEFYRTWGFVYSSAFLALPFSAIIAFFVGAHVRIEVMFIVNNSIHATLLGLLVVGLWPSQAHTVFCIDSCNAELASTFGNTAGSLLDVELKKGEYDAMGEDSILTGNG